MAGLAGFADIIRQWNCGVNSNRRFTVSVLKYVYSIIIWNASIQSCAHPGFQFWQLQILAILAILQGRQLWNRFRLQRPPRRSEPVFFDN